MAANTIYRALFAGPYGSRTSSGYVYIVIDSANQVYDEVMYATEAQPANAVVLLPRSEALYIHGFFIGGVEVVGNFLVMKTEFEGAGQTHVLKLPDGDDVSNVVSLLQPAGQGQFDHSRYLCMYGLAPSMTGYPHQ